MLLESSETSFLPGLCWHRERMHLSHEPPVQPRPPSRTILHQPPQKGWSLSHKVSAPSTRIKPQCEFWPLLPGQDRPVASLRYSALSCFSLIQAHPLTVLAGDPSWLGLEMSQEQQ